MTNLVPKYEGMDRLTARKAIVEDLDKLEELKIAEGNILNIFFIFF